MQALNVQNQGQAQVAQPGIAQQAFAAELQRTAEKRPSQVQPPQQRTGPEKTEVLGQDRGERRRRAPGAAGRPDADSGAGRSGTEEGSRLDIVI